MPGYLEDNSIGRISVPVGLLMRVVDYLELYERHADDYVNSDFSAVTVPPFRGGTRLALVRPRKGGGARSLSKKDLVLVPYGVLWVTEGGKPLIGATLAPPVAIRPTTPSPTAPSGE